MTTRTLAEADRILRELWPTGAPAGKIAEACDRPVRWIYQRRIRLGLTPRKTHDRLPDRIARKAIVARSRHRRLPDDELPRVIERSYMPDPYAVARAEALVEDARRTLAMLEPRPERGIERTLSPIEYTDVGPSLDPGKRAWHDDVRAAAEATA